MFRLRSPPVWPIDDSPTRVFALPADAFVHEQLVLVAAGWAADDGAVKAVGAAD